MANLIKKINTGTSTYEIDAAYLGNRSAADWEAMIHGAIETYVVPTSKSTATAYSKIVGKTDSTITLTQAELKSLVTPAKEFQVGDVILLEAVSTDSEFMFDRWISAIAGTSDTSTITLSILETHVQTHHHTITDSKANAVTGVTTTSTGTLAKVGSAVTVVTGVSGTPSVMTGVAYSGTGSHSIAAATATSTDTGAVGHSHSISEHSHAFTPTTLVSQNADAYTYLSTSTFTQHSHGTASVAGAHKNSSAITYATGVSSVSGEYVVDLQETSTNTGGQSLTTKSNSAANTSSLTVDSTTAIDNAKTSSSGAHTHTVSTTTTENVVKTVTLASKVATGVSKVTNNTTVAANVVTSVSYASQKVVIGGTASSANFFNVATVDSNGVLSFGSDKALTGYTLTSVNVNVVKSVTSTTQSTSAPTVTLTTVDQSSTSGTVTASGSAASNGAHQHGFNHVHAIPTHTHSIDSHTHSYIKTSVSSTGTPTVTLTTSSYTPHTHTSVTVVGSTTNDSNPTTYVYGGTKTTVVRTLKSTSVSTDAKSLTTDTKYYKVAGTINLPELKPTTAKLSTMLATTSITPAVAGEAAVKTVTPQTSQFVTDVEDKTSENKPGK